MELSRGLIESFIRHVSIVIENGSFDTRNTKIANALRLSKKEIKKITKRIEGNDDKCGNK